MKNVAGLDMAKLMIGSFGTLAAIAVVNFRLHPIPRAREHSYGDSSASRRPWPRETKYLKSRLQPVAIDILKSREGYHFSFKPRAVGQCWRVIRVNSPARKYWKARKRTLWQIFANTRRDSWPSMKME